MRRVRWVTSRLLVDLWRIAFGVDARGSFAGVERFGLWESPTGLRFFDPPREGDHQFYLDFYAGLKRRRLMTVETVRPEFLMAAQHVPRGARVLDVGCGLGGFRAYVPEADYAGLDPHAAGYASIADVRSETLAQHLGGHAGSYDAVCCFEVIEHVLDPRALFAELVQAAKPGGLVCVSVPRFPSAMTRIPNFLINAPPHHLTWWSEAALRELANSAGAEVASVENVPFGSESGIYWIERFSPIKCRDVHFRARARLARVVADSSVLGVSASRLAPCRKLSRRGDRTPDDRAPAARDGIIRRRNAPRWASRPKRMRFHSQSSHFAWRPAGFSYMRLRVARRREAPRREFFWRSAARAVAATIRSERNRQDMTNPFEFIQQVRCGGREGRLADPTRDARHDWASCCCWSCSRACSSSSSTRRCARPSRWCLVSAGAASHDGLLRARRPTNGT